MHVRSMCCFALFSLPMLAMAEMNKLEHALYLLKNPQAISTALGDVVKLAFAEDHLRSGRPFITAEKPNTLQSPVPPYCTESEALALKNGTQMHCVFLSASNEEDCQASSCIELKASPSLFNNKDALKQITKALEEPCSYIQHADNAAASGLDLAYDRDSLSAILRCDNNNLAYKEVQIRFGEELVVIRLN